MNDMLKGIYGSYGYKESNILEPLKQECSMTGNDILDQLTKNAPESADTFAEIAALMATQQDSIAKNTSDISTESQRAEDAEKKLEDSIEKSANDAVSSAATYTDEQVKAVKDEMAASAQTNTDAVVAELSAQTDAVKAELAISAQTNADAISELSVKINAISALTNHDATVAELSAQTDAVRSELVVSAQTNADAITAESSARTIADAKLNDKISGETARATSVEEKLGSDISALSDEVIKIDGLTSQNIATILNYIKSENASGETKINGKVDVSSENDVTVYGIYKNDTAAITNITGKAVTVENVNAENARLNIVGSGKTTIDTVVLTGVCPKSLSNAQISINNGDGNDVEFKNSTIKQTSYNAIEIGLNNNALPSNVVIDGVDFENELSNNAILVFGLKDNGTLTVKNCHFANVSNCLRFSNKSNASGITINIEGCTVNKWDSDPEWAGFLIFEDYTSKAADTESSNNLYGDGKITVNLSNVVCNGTKVTADNLTLGAKTANTFAYVYYDKSGYITYEGNENRYPTFNVK